MTMTMHFAVHICLKFSQELPGQVLAPTVAYAQIPTVAGLHIMEVSHAAYIRCILILLKLEINLRFLPFLFAIWAVNFNMHTSQNVQSVQSFHFR